MPGQTDNLLNISALPLPPSDVGSTTGTAGTITLDQSIYGTINSNGDQDWYAIHLVAGRTYDFRLLGVGRTPLPDSIVTLYDSTGVAIGTNDDAGGQLTLNSLLTFTASTTGTYYLGASGFGTNTGDFLLSAVQHNNAGLVFTADEVAWQLTNNFERYFNGNGAPNVPATAYDVSGARQISYNTDALTAAGATLAVNALQQWSDVTGITFVQTHGAGQITFNNSDPGTNAYNNNATLADGTITSSSLMVTTGWLSTFGTTFDSYSFETYIHELGHALGLGHGGNYNGSAIYGTDNYYLNDSQHLSIMSYMQSQHDEFADTSFGYNTFVNAQFRWVLTPMIADILAMSNLYGLSTTTRTGNTTYGYNSNTGNAALDAAVSLNDPANNNYVAFTIFDNGGTDTVDMSGYNGDQRIDLGQGASSDVLGGRLNMGIAYGTVVENAIGGSGNDTITGNASNNSLIGGSGLDILFGGTGNDRLNGVDGGSSDILDGGSGNDVYLTDGGDTLTEALNAGIDTVRSYVNFALGANFENLILVGGSALNGTGNGLGNAITGTGFGNLLKGMAGDDTLNGEGGNDTLIGGGGADKLNGGSGNDVYVTDGSDTLIETPGGGIDTVRSYANFTLGGNFENLVLVGGSAQDGTGNLLDNRITGNALANTLNGGAGNDTIMGAGGSDSLFGGAGDDVLSGGLGHDRLNGGIGADTFVFDSTLGAANADTIAGYSVADDTIRLENAVFVGLSTGLLAASAFTSNLTGVATHAQDRIIYETDTGNLYFDPDGIGGAARVLFATISPNLAMTSSEFFVV